MTDRRIPERDVTLVETNVVVSSLGTRWFRSIAVGEATRRAPRSMYINGVDCGPSYHLRVHKRSAFHYEIVAYQNVLYPTADLPPCTCDSTPGPPLCERHDHAPE